MGLTRSSSVRATTTTKTKTTLRMGDRSTADDRSIEIHGRVYVWVNSTVWLLRDLPRARVRDTNRVPRFVSIE